MSTYGYLDTQPLYGWSSVNVQIKIMTFEKKCPYKYKWKALLGWYHADFI